ncbi:MAG: SDR family oxidoreductase [Anaerolineae bacterium]|nr:MAG: SDR family oxidoreductase [Anaerolineae bacterium]
MGLGATLVLVDRQADALQVVADELAMTARVAAHGLDVTDASAVAHLVQNIEDTTNGLEVVINAAGILHTGAVRSTTPADYAAQMAVNYHGAVHVCLAALPGMLARNRGCLVNLGSIQALRPLPEFAGYAASKAAVWAFSVALRDELAMQHSAVHVAVACPTTVRTPLVEDLVYQPPIYARFPWLPPARGSGHPPRRGAAPVPHSGRLAGAGCGGWSGWRRGWPIGWCGGGVGIRGRK